MLKNKQANNKTKVNQGIGAHLGTLAPDGNLINAFIASGMSPIDAISEFIDNALSNAAGNANSITIIDAGDGMLFMDQGQGVEDINKMFTLGGSNSKKDDQDIGRFGVGSKFGALTFGTLVQVHTVRDGAYKHHTVDWAACARNNVWPDAHDGNSYPPAKAPAAIQGGGTIIVVQDLKIKHRPNISTYTKKLGLRFLPWLEQGKDIIFLRANSARSAFAGKYTEKASIKELFAQYIGERVEGMKMVKGEAMGKPFTLFYGFLPNGDKDLNGVHVNYGGRTVEVIQSSLPGQKMPTKFFARVDLGKEWKLCLNFNKTVLVSGRDELLGEVEKLADSLLSKLADDDQTRMMEKLSMEISNMLGGGFGRAVKKAVTGEVDEAVPEVPDLPEPQEDPVENPIEPKPVKPKKPKDSKGDDSKGSFNILLKPFTAPGAEPLNAEFDFSSAKASCVVGLNRAVPIIAKSIDRSPSNAPATLLLAISAMSRVMAQDEDMIARLLGEEFMGDAGADGPSDIASKVQNKLLTLAAPDLDQELAHV